MALEQVLKDNLVKSYFETHKIVRSYFSNEPDQNELEFVAALYAQRPPNTRAVTTIEDWMFIHDFISGVKPEFVIEFGTASGMATSCIANSMLRNELMDNNLEHIVESFDVLQNVHWDDTLPVGFVVDKLCSTSLKERVKLNPDSTSIDFHKRVDEGYKVPSRTLAFVDAEHSHPWPLIDTLVLLHCLEPGSWILLQDIALFERGYLDMIKFKLENVDWATRGAQYVYEYWDGPKIRGTGGAYNMSALQVPENKRNTISRLSFLRNYPFEKKPSEVELKKLNELLQ